MRMETINEEGCCEALKVDKMDEETFNAMMECGLSQAMRGEFRAASEFLRSLDGSDNRLSFYQYLVNSGSGIPCVLSVLGSRKRKK